MAQFARPQTSQEQSQEHGELPVVARAKERAFLVRSEELDHPRGLDGDAVDLEPASADGGSDATATDGGSDATATDGGSDATATDGGGDQISDADLGGVQSSGSDDSSDFSSDDTGLVDSGTVESDQTVPGDDV